MSTITVPTEENSGDDFEDHTEWWQCEQFGAEGFRKDATKPSCSFQTFTR